MPRCQVVDATAIERIHATRQMPEMLTKLSTLIRVLEEQRDCDTRDVVDGTRVVVDLANSSSLRGHGDREQLQFQLRRMGGQRAPLHFEYIAASVLSSLGSHDLQRLNPLLDKAAARHELPKACASILLRTIRLCQTNRAIVSANALKKDMTSLLTQQLRTQVAATLAVAARPSSRGEDFTAQLRQAASWPTEELLKWAMRECAHSPAEALQKVTDKVGECVALAGEAAVQRLADRDELRDDAERVNKLSGLVWLAMHLTGYRRDGATALLSDREWAMAAIALRRRGCYVRKEKPRGVDTAAFPGLGSDHALAPLMYVQSDAYPTTQVHATPHHLPQSPTLCLAFSHLLRICLPTSQELVTPPKAGTDNEKGGVKLIGAMLHAMNYTSLTLATDLTARRHYMRPKYEETPWTAEEDARLIAWVEQRALRNARPQPSTGALAPTAAAGGGNGSRSLQSYDPQWENAPHVRTGRRSKTECITRWMSALAPEVRHGNDEARAWASRLQRPTRLVYDPRFLVFEFLLGFMLRRRQFELVSEFAQAAIDGRSSVNQMIMGQGKTTVIAPMLALILADGRRLIMQICPAPLLEMSRSVMRTSFSNIIHKRVYTFTFDRSNKIGNSLEGVQAQYEKLAAAREEKAVVCSTPESVKSFMLKYIDNLHVVEAAPPQLLLPQHAVKMKSGQLTQAARELAERDLIADEMAKVLKLWRADPRGGGTGGIALLDEVDLLLHPLRSELNFPVGEKDPLDGSPFRWDFAVHLLDALFKRSWKGSPSSPEVVVDKGSDKARRLALIGSVIEGGAHEKEKFAIQREPHYVLLRKEYYQKRTKDADDNERQSLCQLMAMWAAEWLRVQSAFQVHNLPRCPCIPS